MRAEEFENPKENFVEMFRKFLPLAMKIIGLKSLPRMVFEKEIYSPEQPTFGQYVNDEHVLHVGLANRHPNDILRTIAHELVHYKQDTEHKLNDMSGATGSPEENEANALAGIVMRNFNKRYPEYLKTKPIVNEGAGAVTFAGKDPNVAEDNATQYVAALYVDEFADGDHWYIKGTPDVIQRFVQLANSLEDEAVKGTEYEPGVGMMAKIHKDLGDDSIPQWKIVPATNLEQIKPITGASLRALMTADLSDGAGEFMSDFLWNLEEKGQALVHDGSEQSVSESFDKEAEAWRDWQLKMLPRKMEMLSKLVKGWVPSKEDHIAAIEAGYDAMKNTGDVKDAAKAISDTFNEIQRRQGVAESDDHPKSFTNNGLTWTLEHLGSIDGKDLGAGGLIDIFKGYQDINSKGKFRWFIRGQRTGVLRPVSSEHTAIRKFLHPNVANNDEYKKFTEQGVAENFADGRNPQDKGDSARHGIRKGMTIAQLKKIRSSKTASPRKKQLAHWQINMRQGRKK